MVNFRDFQNATRSWIEDPSFEKDFDGWHTKKKSLERSGWLHPRSDTYINAGEIWWTYTGVNIGWEICGKSEFRRPVLVIRKAGNVFLVASMTTHGNEKRNPSYYYRLPPSELVLQDDSLVVLTQLRAMDKKRFIEKIPYPMNQSLFREIKDKIKILYDL